MSNGKKIILSVVGLVLVAAIVVGVLYLVKTLSPLGQDDTTSAEGSASSWRPDTSHDYGACTRVPKSTIESALQGKVASVYGPDNMGYFVGKGFTKDGPVSYDMQSCIYPFAPGASVDNVYNQYDGLIVTVSHFRSQADADAVLALAREGDKGIGGIGQHAVYTSSASGEAGKAFSLNVIDGMTQYQYEIKQSSGKITFTDDSAREALVTIAR